MTGYLVLPSPGKRESNIIGPGCTLLACINYAIQHFTDATVMDATACNIQV